ncbi:PREDICTED: uncharacterized protein LOC109338232 isoform X1 [Lupinus angustifolius]|uniref:uncharacterized protein LOC109338232 isoform X1 n=1 Tax=Lupinus angustifolius TaxID=3871 RepID=UPI00092F7A5E|nr:PREDICTED: uncharacterized protein LOC109338232 isoform X1 [Lupinus angustifolius]XP_019430969.1 PREDICTED: uncharacterized protein LOC109338232 isoform X1 [Lupinus angustifolius]
MNGVGSSKDWSYYASNPPNLSAFATSFGVNQPNSNDASTTFVDSSEFLYGSVSQTQYPKSHNNDFILNPKRDLNSTQPSRPPSMAQLVNVDSMGLPPKDSSNELGSTQWHNFNSMGLSRNPMDGFSYGQSSNDTRPGLVKAQPHYPSHVLAPIGTPIPSAAATNYSSSAPGFAPLEGSSLGDYANKSPDLGFSGQRAGLWNQTPEFNNGKGKQIADITGLVGEERMKQGDLNSGALLLPHQLVGQGKNSVPINAGQLEDKPCQWETVKPMPFECSTASFMRSPPVTLESYLADKYVADSGSGNLLLPYTGSYDKDLRQHDKPSGVGTVSSPRTGFGMDLNTGNIIADGDLGNNKFYNIKQAYDMFNPGTTGGFDSSYLRMHLERDDHSSSNNAMISENHVSRHIVHDIFKEGLGFQNYHASVDNLSSKVSAIEDVNSVEKFYDGGDRYNPAVDSPCWNGAPAAHFSPHEASVALPPEYVHKKADCFGSVIHEPQNFLLDNNNNMKYSCGNSNRYHHPEMCIAGSPIECSETKEESEYSNSDGTVSAGSFQSESSYGCGLQYLDDDTETEEDSVASTMPKYVGESGSSHTFGGADAGSNVNESVEHSAPYPAGYALLNRSLALDAPKTGGADSKCNVNKCMAALYTPEDDHFKRSLTVDALNTLEESAGKVSTKKLSFPVLVDTMHNLSELLLFHCLNDACELKERDRNILKNVINNLNTCALENAKQFTSAQEYLPLKPENFRGAGESCHLQQNSSFEKPQLTEVVPDSAKVGFENLPVQEAENLHFRYEKPQWNLSDSLSSWDKAEMTKEDKTTKALMKKILSENLRDDEEADSEILLYKSLWLEAKAAALCSVSDRARYNQMKIEMENHSHKQKDMEQSNPEVVPSLSENQSSVTKSHIESNLDSFLQDMVAFDATFEKHHTTGLQFSADMNKPNALTPEGTDTEDLDSSIHDSVVSCTDEEVEDDEASVIARFRVLKARADKSCINTANPVEPSGIAAEKLSPRQKNNQSQINFYQDSSIPCKNEAADYEASVMTRFQFLKSWIEYSSSFPSERKLLDDDTSDDASEDQNFDVHVNPSEADLISYTTVDKSIPNEEFLMGSPQKVELCVTCEDDNQLLTNYSDDIASDWEHV